jgi:hypothetical protein
MADYWQGCFAPAAMHNSGGGLAMYRKCLHCGGHALEGSLSAHARWCAKERQKSLTLAAFDALESADRRTAIDRRDEVRAAARSAL